MITRENITEQSEFLQEKKVNRKINIAKISILFLVIANFIVLGIDGINRASDPEAWDTTAYLGEATFIQAHGGVLNFINLCISGGWKQDNQQPLYILMITPFASAKISFFVIAKLVNFSISLILLFILYFFAAKKFGDLVASIAIIGLLLGNVFLDWSTLVACESTVMLFALLAFIFIWEGFNSNKYWTLAGLFTGLAYLAKAIGIALVPGFVIAAFLVYRFKVFKNKFFWSFLFMFFLISSPLLIRNTLLYQNPFFNYNVYIVKYGVEKFESIQYVVFNMNEGSSIWKFDETKTDDNQSNKLNSNKPTSNVFTRAFTETKAFVTSFNILQNYFGGKSFWVTAVILIILFLVGLSKLANKGMRYFIGVTISIFLFLLSFNPVPRYFLILISLIWICIGLGAVTSIDYVFKKLSSNSKLIKAKLSFEYTLILFLILFIGYKIPKLNLSNPFKNVEYSENRFELLKWLEANLQSTDKYTLGPNFYWQLNKGTWILPPNAAKYKDISKLELFVRKHDVRYIIFDRDILLKYHSIDLIKNNFSVDPNEGIKEILPIDDWQLIYKDTKKPVDYLIYEAQNKNHLENF